MQKVAVYIDPTITVHDLAQAARLIGCHIGLDGQGGITISKAAPVELEPLDDLPDYEVEEVSNITVLPGRDELAGRESTLIDIPAWLRRQAE